MARKPSTGYDKNKRKKTKKTSYLTNLIMPGRQKIPFMERVIKFLIFICLRFIIKPTRWKDPQKNYELIDRIYKRLMSSDFVFIPSSIAFYIIIAFMPVISIILLLTSIPGLSDIFEAASIVDVLGRFIPGIEPILSGFSDLLDEQTTAEYIGGISGIIFLLFISIWIAAGGFAKLVYTQSYIYEHKFSGGWWMNRFKGMFIVIALSFFMLLALFINIQIEKMIYSWDLSYGWSEFFVYLFLILVLFILLFGGMVVLFKLSPRFKIKLRHVLPGAVVTAFPTTLFLSLFALFASLLSYSIYGVIAILMYIGLVALWLSNFIFIGLITNAAYYKTHVKYTIEHKWTVSNK